MHGVTMKITEADLRFYVVIVVDDFRFLVTFHEVDVFKKCANNSTLYEEKRH